MVLISTLCFAIGLYGYFVAPADMTPLMTDQASFLSANAIHFLVIGGIISAINVYLTFINNN